MLPSSPLLARPIARRLRDRASQHDSLGHIRAIHCIAYAVSAATELMGFDTFADWVLGLWGCLPGLLISIFMLFLGCPVAAEIRNLITAVAETNGFQHGQTLGHLAAGLIVAPLHCF